jgi:phospholipase/carboxylesterase
MSDGSIVVSQPQAPSRLVLLFHGVGSSAANLVPLAQFVASARPDGQVVSVESPHLSAWGSGHEWFSVAGVTEENRPDRVAAAMPVFLETVEGWQRASGLPPSATTLIGFSQGAIMSLEATQSDGVFPASQVISLAGRFAAPVRKAAPGIRFHLIHGEEDPVIQSGFSSRAADAIRHLGGAATLDLLPRLAHGIDERVALLVAGYVK